MEFRALAFALAVGAVGSGCAGRMIDPREPLPLTRVVLYRNGIGYFERAGTVRGDSLRFRVRREQVGDFLATLAVRDSQGGVQSVAFPVEEVEGEPAEHVDVEVGLDGSEVHDVRVTYVVEAPIWRPTYRVVLGEEGAALQGWAIVQNTSGEPWADVRMSVTSGAPLSFRADLSRPVIPRRPMVTDSGELVLGPVYAETTLSEPEEEEVQLDEEAASGVADEAPPPSAPAASARRSAAPRPSSPAPARPSTEAATSAPAMSVESLLASADPSGGEGEARRGGNRYDVPGLVTVPNSGSTMVVILDAAVPGEDALLYRPDPSVPGSDTYPMRVLRLRNTTGVLLERGPVAIYEDDALLGQGLVSALPTGATTTIPFAVERGVAIAVEQQSQRTPARLVKIAGGRVTVEEFDQRSTTYEIQNGVDRATKIFIRHGTREGWELLEPPEGTEQVEGASLLPVALSPSRDAELEVVERTPLRRTVDFMSEPAVQAVGFYLEGPAIDAAAGPVLRAAMGHRDRLAEIRRLQELKRTQREELRRAAGEVRTNLRALEGNERAESLRDRLTRRLTELTARIEVLTNEIVELELERSELTVRLSETLRELTLEGNED